jgi:hypothetical protein
MKASLSIAHQCLWPNRRRQGQLLQRYQTQFHYVASVEVRHGCSEQGDFRRQTSALPINLLGKLAIKHTNRGGEAGMAGTMTLGEDQLD